MSISSELPDAWADIGTNSELQLVVDVAPEIEADSVGEPSVEVFAVDISSAFVMFETLSLCITGNCSLECEARKREKGIRCRRKRSFLSTQVERTSLNTMFLVIVVRLLSFSLPKKNRRSDMAPTLEQDTYSWP